MNFFSAACIVVAATALALAIYAWKLDPRGLLNRLLVMTALVAAFRVLGSGLVNLAGEPSFWLVLRLTLTASLFVVPLMFAVNLAFARVSRRWVGLLVAPILLATLGELWPLWTGQWLVAGYRSGPWGNELIPSDQTLWIFLFDSTVVYGWLVALAAFVRGYFTTTSGRQKAIVVQLFVFLLLINLISLFLAPAFWNPRWIASALHSQPSRLCQVAELRS